MEQNTDLSREFGSSSERRQQEFGSDPAALDPKTDLSPEFSHPPDAEFGSIGQQQEFPYDSAADAVKQPSRRERHRRTLLLQMAAAALTTVLVTSSFGLDILGDDMLFSESGSSASDPNTFSRASESIYAALLQDDSYGSGSLEVVYERGTVYDVSDTFGDTIRYDPDSNTLYLRGCALDELSVSLSNPLTIYVEENSSIGLLNGGDGSIILDGEPGVLLDINNGVKRNSWWWHGIVLRCAGTNTALTIEPGIIVEVRGSWSADGGAIAISNTSASAAIRYDESRTAVTGTVASGTFDFGDGFSDPEHEHLLDWTVLDESGEQSSFVRFAPIGYEPDEPNETDDPYTPITPSPGESTQTPTSSTLSIQPEDGSDSIVLYENGALTPESDAYRSAVSYDPATNTLTLSSTPLAGISAWHMGAGFTVHVPENVSIGFLHVQDGGLTLSGENTLLTVNDEMTQEYGIYVDAAEQAYCLQIDPGISISAAGSRAALAVANSSLLCGLSYDPACTGIYDSVKTGGYAFPSSAELTASSFCDTTIVDEKDPSGAPATVIYIDGFSTGTLHTDGVYVTLTPGGSVVNLLDNPQAVPGAVYDDRTGTLFLTDLTADQIELRGLSRSELYISGTCQIGQIYSDGSVHFSGDAYSQLMLNDRLDYSSGLVIYANGTPAVLSAQWGPDIEVYGWNAAAVVVRDSTALQGIALGTNVLSSGTIMQGALADDQFAPDIGVRSWTVWDDSAALPSRRVTISSDHSGGPSEDGHLNLGIGSETYTLFAGTLPTGVDKALDGVSYDHATNTLTLTNVTFNNLVAYSMGSEFTIQLVGDNYGTSILTLGSPDSADGSLHIRGDERDPSYGYGSLTLTAGEEDSYGILVNAMGGSSMLQLDWVELLAITAPETVIAVRDSTAECGIDGDGVDVPADSIVLRETEFGTEWVLTDSESGQALTETRLCGGFGGGGYLEQNGIIVSDYPHELATRWIYSLDVGLEQDERDVVYREVHYRGDSFPYFKSSDNVSYDADTNTLNLVDCNISELEVVNMGSDFRICLTGSCRVDRLILNATDATFCGSGTLNVSDGLRLEAQNRSHSIFVEAGVTLNLSDSVSALRIHASTADQPLVLATGVTASGQLARGLFDTSIFDVTAVSSAYNYSLISEAVSCEEFTQYTECTQLIISSPQT